MDYLELAEETINDLLFEDLELPDANPPFSDELTGISENANATKTELSKVVQESAYQVVEKLKSDLQLSDAGVALVKKLVDTFVATKNKDRIVGQFPLLCMDAKKYFLENLTKSKAAENLLVIIKDVMKKNEPVPAPSYGQIQAFENDTLEYIGGYIIRKTTLKFPDMPEIIECLSQQSPHGSLIKSMEKYSGCLKYPSDEFLLFLQHVYLKITKQTKKMPTQINFNNVSDEVLSGVNCSNFQTLIQEITEMLIRCWRTAIQFNAPTQDIWVVPPCIWRNISVFCLLLQK
ncbi:uncharacterized protein LOC113475742 isoform X1 [Ciona intestinalis]